MSFYLVFIVAGFVIGLLTRGRWQRLEALPLRYGWLLGVGILLRFPLMFWEKFSQATQGWIGASLQLGGLACVLAFGLLNRHIKGIFWVCLGTLLTIIPIAANGGYMPGDDAMYLALLKSAGMMEQAAAFEAGMMSYHTSALTETTRLWVLTDIIPIPRVTFYPFVVSFGDVFIGIGMFLVVLWGMHHDYQATSASPAPETIPSA